MTLWAMYVGRVKLVIYGKEHLSLQRIPFAVFLIERLREGDGHTGFRHP